MMLYLERWAERIQEADDGKILGTDTKHIGGERINNHDNR
jgi:hypothetical protein